MEIAIKDIRVPDRIRQDMGDLAGLSESLRTCGQLNPITLTREYELVAGRRRLEAARRLGWQTLEARIVDGASDLQRLQMEIQENLHRKDFTPEELLLGIKRLERLERPRFSRRIRAGFKRMIGWFGFLRLRRRPRTESPSVPAAHA